MLFNGMLISKYTDFRSNLTIGQSAKVLILPLNYDHNGAISGKYFEFLSFISTFYVLLWQWNLGCYLDMNNYAV